jgi:hypothetical protein
MRHVATTKRTKAGDEAWPAMPTVTSAVLLVRRRPTPQRRMSRPASRPERKYAVAARASGAPSIAWGRVNVSRRDGQATPSTVSGNPRLTKARYASARSAARERVASGGSFFMGEAVS